MMNINSEIIQLPPNIEYSALAALDNVNIDAEEGEYDLCVEYEKDRDLCVVASLDDYETKSTFYEDAVKFLGLIKELDNDVYGRSLSNNSRRFQLGILKIAKDELVLWYFGSNVNSDWEIAYSIDADGGWAFNEYR